MSEQHFEKVIEKHFSHPDMDPLWATAVNLAGNVSLRNCELTQRGLELLCCAILQKDKDELSAKQSNT